MNRKQLILLLLVLIVLGGLSLILLNHHEESWSTSGGALGQKVLPNFQMNEVAAIHIQGNGDLNLLKKEGKWRVQERGNYPADFGQISDLLLKVGGLKVAQSEDIGPSQLSRMHLAAPGSGPDAATLLEFKDAQNKPLQALLLGKKHMSEGSARGRSQFGNSEMPDGRYLMRPTSPSDLITVSEPLDAVEAQPANWLNKDFFKVEKPKSISFVSTNASNSWTIARETENASWVLVGAKTNEILDQGKVTPLGSSLSSPSFVDVATNQTPSVMGLENPSVVKIETFDHYNYLLKVGSKNAQNNYYLQVSVTGDLPSQRLVAKDEKPADKKKFDDLYQAQVKTFQTKLTAEKELANWTYLVSNWLLDPLVRNRDQLFVSKKEAAPAGGGKPDATELPLPEDKNDNSSPLSLPGPTGQ